MKIECTVKPPYSGNLLDFADLYLNSVDYKHALEHFEKVAEIITDITRDNVDTVSDLMKCISEAKKKIKEQRKQY